MKMYMNSNYWSIVLQSQYKLLTNLIYTIVRLFNFHSKDHLGEMIRVFLSFGFKLNYVNA
jgi:hypothetical protein